MVSDVASKPLRLGGLYQVVVHRWPVLEQDSTKLDAQLVRTKLPTHTHLFRHRGGDFARGRVEVDFGIAGLRQFSLTPAGRGRCISPGLSDYVLAVCSLAALRELYYK